MKPEEKLREDIRYWEEQERDATEILRYASVVLPGLRESLKRVEQNGCGPPEEGNGAAALQADPAPPPAVTGRGDALRLHGGCEDQILQALGYVGGELTPNQLMDYLKEHGRAFSRGAVDYNLRALYAQKKIDRRKPTVRGMHAVWVYFLPASVLSEAQDGALIG